jgi:hypothetical protein
MDTGALDKREPAKATHFAPAERASLETLSAQLDRVITDPLVKTILESLGGFVVIINQQRQILTASAELRDLLLANGCENFVGLRPGEALGCVHAQESANGCGTSAQCSHCGAVIAILAAQCSDMPVEEECWITLRRQESIENIEFRARATPLTACGTDLMVLVLHDISSHKRRAVLERKFLHQTRNLLSGIVTWSEVMEQENSNEATRTIRDLAFQLRDLIVRQSVIDQAEKGQLIVRREKVPYDCLVTALSATFSHLASSEGKNLVFHPGRDLPHVISDRNILLSILGTMVENAIEATPKGGTIHVRHEIYEGQPSYVVANPGVMPPHVAERIFQRSFTTKNEPGRGMGTYSMRLLASQGLAGEVLFTSTPKTGTLFRLVLPEATSPGVATPAINR